MQQININLHVKQRNLLSFTSIKGALSGLRQFLAAENPLKMIKKKMQGSFYSQDI